MIVTRILGLLLVLTTACAGGRDAAPGSPPETLTVALVTDDPAAYDGQRIRVRGAYFGARETSVLASGFAESHPPQPVDPQIWVVATPPESCLQRAEQVGWAEGVTAVGTFRYQEGGGLGHLGSYEMALEDARLTCS